MKRISPLQVVLIVVLAVLLPRHARAAVCFYDGFGGFNNRVVLEIAAAGESFFVLAG